MYRTYIAKPQPQIPPRASWWRRALFVVRGGQERLTLRKHCQILLQGMPNAHERWKARQTALQEHPGRETSYLHAVWNNAVIWPESLSQWEENGRKGPKPVPLPLPMRDQF